MKMASTRAMRALRPLVLLLTWLMAPPAQGARALSLADAIALARQHRSEVAAAAIDVRLADLELLRARLQRARLRVATSFVEQAQRLDLGAPPEICVLSPTTCDREAHRFEALATLSVPLWTGLAIEAGIAGARAAREAAVAQERATFNAVALDVAQSYWAVRRAELLHDVGAAVLESNRLLEQLTRRKVDAGVAPLVDFNRAHVLVVRLEQQISSIDAGLGEARAQLGAALQIDEPVSLTDDPRRLAVRLPALPEVEGQALATRAEVGVARAIVAAQAQAVRAARGAYWPQVALVGQAHAGNQVFFVPERREALVLSALAGVELSWVPFDSLTTWTAVREAADRHQRARVEAERLESQVLAQVRASHARMSGAIARRALVEQAITTQRESVDILRRRYQVGGALLIELLLAQVDLSQQEFDLVDASVDIAESQARLDAAIGRLP